MPPWPQLAVDAVVARQAVAENGLDVDHARLNVSGWVEVASAEVRRLAGALPPEARSFGMDFATRSFIVAALVAAASAELLIAQSQGQAVYRTKCASCHDGDGAVRAPRRISLGGMTPRALLATLTQGTMREVAATLSDADRRAVAEYLTQRSLEPAVLPAAAYCAGPKAPAAAASSEVTSTAEARLFAATARNRHEKQTDMWHRSSEGPCWLRQRLSALRPSVAKGVSFVGHSGLEPEANGLRIHCSTN